MTGEVPIDGELDAELLSAPPLCALQANSNTSRSVDGA